MGDDRQLEQVAIHAVLRGLVGWEYVLNALSCALALRIGHSGL